VTTIRPKKHLGQHFLQDENIARKIVACLPDEARNIVEIGPGMGVLTKYLVKKEARLWLVEYDREAVEFLSKEFSGYPDLKICHADFLEWPIVDEAGERPWFIGNVPYNISSQIFFRLLEHAELVAGGVFMVQKEVAERISASPCTKEYGILSVLLGAFFSVKTEFAVSENVFFPKPKVKSAVIVLKPLNRQPLKLSENLRRVVKAAFSHRRKILRNNLMNLEFNDMPMVEAWQGRRAEELSIDEYIELAGNLK